MNKEHNEFLQLIELSPAVKLLEIGTHTDGLSLSIARHLKTVDGELHIQEYPGEHIVLQENNIQVGGVKDFTSAFKVLAREYAVIIIRDVLDKHEHAQQIIKSAYKALLNSAELIVIQKKQSMSVEVMKNILQTNEFRAVSDIDIFKDSHLVMGKKMHMWGNGL